MSLARQTSIILCAALATALAVAACGSGGKSTNAQNTGSVSKPTGNVTMMAEHEFIEPKIFNPFKEANPGLSVQAAEVEGSQEAATKLSAGFKADLVETCAEETAPLLKRGLLQPIDTSKLTHWNDLTQQLREPKGATENGKLMFLPLQAGPHGLVYNVSAFPNGVDSIKELFKPTLKGKVALDGESKTMIAMTALSLGIKEPFNMSSTQLEKVGKYLVAHAGQFRAFPRSDADQLNLMKSKEVVLMDSGFGTATEMVEGGVNVKWVAPKEGAFAWDCGLAITKDAQNLNADYALLNYYSSIPAQVKFGEEGYVVLNSKALPKVSPQHAHSADPASLNGVIVEHEPPEPQRWQEIYQEVVAG